MPICQSPLFFTPYIFRLCKIRERLTSTQCIMWNNSSTQSSPCHPFPASIFSLQCWKCLAGSEHSLASQSFRIAGAG